MKTNQLPQYNMSDNPTDCCPRFNATDWNGLLLRFDKKKFVKAKSRSLLHVPINMGQVFARTFRDLQAIDAQAEDDIIVLSKDTSAWTAEHYFSVIKDVPDYEMVEMNGWFLTKVFEGPYKEVRKWMDDMDQYVLSKGYQTKEKYFFYTTCPKCAKYYGENYVVAVWQV